VENKQLGKMLVGMVETRGAKPDQLLHLELHLFDKVTTQGKGRMEA